MVREAYPKIQEGSISAHLILVPLYEYQLSVALKKVAVEIIAVGPSPEA